ncbi:hypothetical protein FOA52_009947 [Chlamydomonas sp. UWO 241]|nr:hypothetical protein FOA52_009947 [Chlamydomonas sp. UWO 241]
MHARPLQWIASVSSVRGERWEAPCDDNTGAPHADAPGPRSALYESREGTGQSSTTTYPAYGSTGSAAVSAEAAAPDTAPRHVPPSPAIAATSGESEGQSSTTTYSMHGSTASAAVSAEAPDTAPRHVPPPPAIAATGGESEGLWSPGRLGKSVRFGVSAAPASISISARDTSPAPKPGVPPSPLGRWDSVQHASAQSARGPGHGVFYGGSSRGGALCAGEPRVDIEAAAAAAMWAWACAGEKGGGSCGGAALSPFGATGVRAVSGSAVWGPSMAPPLLLPKLRIVPGSCADGDGELLDGMDEPLGGSPTPDGPFGSRGSLDNALSDGASSCAGSVILEPEPPSPEACRDAPHVRGIALLLSLLCLLTLGCLSYTAYAASRMEARALRLFAVYFLPALQPLLMLWGWAHAMYAFEVRNVNISDCFHSPLQLSGAGAASLALAFTSLFSMFACWFAAACEQRRYDLAAYPVWIMFPTAALFLLLRLGDIAHGKARYSFLGTTLRMLFPIMPVLFEDFILADVFTSVTISFVYFNRSVCYMTTGPPLQELADPSFTGAPNVCGRQCAKLWVSHNYQRRHVANALKYLMCMVPLILAVRGYQMDHIGHGFQYAVPLFVTGIISSLYRFVWDVECDWGYEWFLTRVQIWRAVRRAEVEDAAERAAAGVGGVDLEAPDPDPSGRSKLDNVSRARKSGPWWLLNVILPALPETRLFGRAVYFAVAPLDLVLLMLWLAALDGVFGDVSLVVLVVSVLSVFRRYMWLFLRLEHELRKINAAEADLEIMCDEKWSPALRAQASFRRHMLGFDHEDEVVEKADAAPPDMTRTRSMTASNFAAALLSSRNMRAQATLSAARSQSMHEIRAGGTSPSRSWQHNGAAVMTPSRLRRRGVFDVEAPHQRPIISVLVSRRRLSLQQLSANQSARGAAARRPSLEGALTSATSFVCTSYARMSEATSALTRCSEPEDRPLMVDAPSRGGKGRRLSMRYSVPEDGPFVEDPEERATEGRQCLSHSLRSPLHSPTGSSTYGSGRSHHSVLLTIPPDGGAPPPPHHAGQSHHHAESGSSGGSGGSSGRSDHSVLLMFPPGGGAPLAPLHAGQSHHHHAESGSSGGSGISSGMGGRPSQSLLRFPTGSSSAFGSGRSVELMRASLHASLPASRRDDTSYFHPPSMGRAVEAGGPPDTTCTAPSAPSVVAVVVAADHTGVFENPVYGAAPSRHAS